MNYFDTCCLVPLYLPEGRSDVAEEIAANSKIAVSDLSQVEVASALSLRVRTKSIQQSHARWAYRAFTKDLDTGRFVRVRLAEADLLQAGVYLSSFDPRLSLRTLDALHLAMCDARGHTLHTSDRDLHAAAGRLGVACVII